jgi:ergothioneine biosynthesis protein EgtB
LEFFLPPEAFSPPSPAALSQAYAVCRADSLELMRGLSEADATAQSMPDASPAKWHLAHTSWFFECFVLQAHVPGYRVFDPRFGHLFNSYYDAVGDRHPRPLRGLLTRPSLAEVLAYRHHVDQALMQALRDDALPPPAMDLVTLGTQHEQQHQELLVTDALHLFSQNPLRPAWHAVPRATLTPDAHPASWIEFEGGPHTLGHAGDGFAFDCETPSHAVLLAPFALSSQLVRNAEWQAFMEDGGYRDPRWWLSDGWARCRAEDWQAPLYWRRPDGDGPWLQMGVNGEQPVDPDAPVCHVCGFEADAFARWAGRRLPTEFEWEVAARLHGSGAPGHTALRQLFGAVWQWTASPYTPYPRFRPAPGAVGEYNGKFMCGQLVLRGSSWATPAGHARPTYRNFFYPHQRWQLTGLRLAEDRPR